MEFLCPWLESADLVVAADGAANALIRMGCVPDIVVGDMDSIEPYIRVQIEEVHEDPDQETTDVDKLVSFLAGRGTDAVTLACLEGDRLDHVFSAVQGALKAPFATRILLRQGLAYVVRDRIEVDSHEGQAISFIPMVECSGVEMEGVKWPPKSVLSPLGDTSISNVATGDKVSARLEKGAGLLFVNRDSRVPIW